MVLRGENQFRILIADNQGNDAQKLEQLLIEAGGKHHVVLSSSYEESEELLRTERLDVVLISLSLLIPANSLPRLRQAAPLVPFVVLARIDDTLTGLNVLREGAQEYLVKDQLSSTLLSRTIRYAIERNRTELALKESEDRLRDLAENSHDLICTHDLEGNILWLNPFPAALLGYEVSELKKMKMQNILAPRFRQQFSEYIKTIQTCGTAKGIMNVVSKSGEVRVWEYHNTLRTQGVDRPVVRGMAHDITEITKAEEELRLSQERFQLASLAAQDVIWDWDVRTGKVWWSENLHQVFGHLVVSALPVDWWKSQIHAEDAEEIERKRNLFISSQDTNYTMEYRFRRGDSSYSHVQERGFIVRKAGRTTRIIGALTDISERIKYQQQLLLSRKVEAIVRLAGGIAHDFNNLMMTIHVNCEVIEMKLPEQSRDLKEIQAIMDAALKGSVLTHQLLSFSRKQIMQTSALDLGGFVLAMKPLLEETLGEHIHCLVELCDAPSLIHADASLLREVLTVLAANAKEAMDGKGELKIKTETVTFQDAEVAPLAEMPTGSYIKLDVSDTGIGMTSETQLRLFEPYFSTKDVGHGQGLSLASVYGIIKQSQGHISIDSELGKGATFHLYFPLIK